jgi:hypothetical protein
VLELVYVFQTHQWWCSAEVVYSAALWQLTVLAGGVNCSIICAAMVACSWCCIVCGVCFYQSAISHQVMLLPVGVGWDCWVDRLYVAYYRVT